MRRIMLAALAVTASIGSAQAATTLAGNETGRLEPFPEGVVGQSFSFDSSVSSVFNNIVFSFQNIRGENVGAGKLYLLDYAYTGMPISLPSVNFLDVADFNGGKFAFKSTQILTSDKKYYVYSDSSFRVALSNAGTYSGGNGFSAYNKYNNFFDAKNVDLRFQVTGNAVETTPTPGVTSAVPEPATWAMMILGFGLVGGYMRRRQQNVGVRFA